MKTLKQYLLLSDKASRHQSGFSLIELMISMTIGAFLMGGVITSFIGTKDSERMRSAISDMDADARTAMAVLRQNISHAGYPSIENTVILKPFFTESDGNTSNDSCGGGVNMNILGATPDSSWKTKNGSDSTYGDTLTAVYLADNPCVDGKASCPNIADINPNALVYTDCGGGGNTRGTRAVSCSTDPTAGMPNPMDAKIYSSFYVKKSDHTLYCRGNRAGVKVPLVDNVENIRFRYGIIFPDGSTKYFHADQIDNKIDGSDWGAVTSVQVGLLMRSFEKNISKKVTKEYHTLLNSSVKVTDRHRLYRAYTTTIVLANRNKRPIR